MHKFIVVHIDTDMGHFFAVRFEEHQVAESEFVATYRLAGFELVGNSSGQPGLVIFLVNFTGEKRAVQPGVCFGAAFVRAAEI